MNRCLRSLLCLLLNLARLLLNLASALGNLLRTLLLRVFGLRLAVSEPASEPRAPALLRLLNLVCSVVVHVIDFVRGIVVRCLCFMCGIVVRRSRGCLGVIDRLSGRALVGIELVLRGSGSTVSLGACLGEFSLSSTLRRNSRLLGWWVDATELFGSVPSCRRT